jgi:hypothetical protein
MTEVAALNAPQEKPSRRVPLRTCVACRTTGGKRGLLRLVRLPQAKGERAEEGKEATSSKVVLDPTGKKSGRGAYVCATEMCVENALKRKQFERSLKTPLDPETVAALRQVIAGSPE